MFGKRKKGYSMTYKEAVRYLKTAYKPSSELLDSLSDLGPTSMRSIDTKVLEAQEIVNNYNIEKGSKFKYGKP